jgi:hypothetical protein
MFMPAAKCSARTPLGLKLFYLFQVLLADYNGTSLTALTFNDVLEQILSIRSHSLIPEKEEDDITFEIRKEDIFEKAIKLVKQS